MPGTGKTTAKQDRDAWRAEIREVQDMMNSWGRPDDDSSVDTHRIYRRLDSAGDTGHDAPAGCSHRRTQKTAVAIQPDCGTDKGGE